MQKSCSRVARRSTLRAESVAVGLIFSFAAIPAFVRYVLKDWPQFFSFVIVTIAETEKELREGMGEEAGSPSCFEQYKTLLFLPTYYLLVK